MPYIKKERRTELALGDNPQDIGELNYQITVLILFYLDNSESGELNYAKYNSIIGVLECIKQEITRRLIVPYENKKRDEHGEVFNI
jgi:hypothetical protein